MNWGVTGLLILFGAFVLLLIFNPNLSCFGKRLKSPFYPLYRRKKHARDEEALKAKRIRTEDYGFKLSDDETPPAPGPPSGRKKGRGLRLQAGSMKRRPDDGESRPGQDAGEKSRRGPWLRGFRRRSLRRGMLPPARGHRPGPRRF